MEQKQIVAPITIEIGHEQTRNDDVRAATREQLRGCEGAPALGMEHLKPIRTLLQHHKVIEPVAVEITKCDEIEAGDRERRREEPVASAIAQIDLTAGAVEIREPVPVSIAKVQSAELRY